MSVSLPLSPLSLSLHPVLSLKYSLPSFSPPPPLSPSLLLSLSPSLSISLSLSPSLPFPSLPLSPSISPSLSNQQIATEFRKTFSPIVRVDMQNRCLSILVYESELKIFPLSRRARSGVTSAVKGEKVKKEENEMDVENTKEEMETDSNEQDTE